MASTRANHTPLDVAEVPGDELAGGLLVEHVGGTGGGRLVPKWSPA